MQISTTGRSFRIDREINNAERKKTESVRFELMFKLVLNDVMTFVKQLGVDAE